MWIPSPVNKTITETQLKDLYNAIKGLQIKRGKSIEEATQTANDLTYAVFRNILTYESMIETVVRKTRELFI